MSVETEMETGVSPNTAAAGQPDSAVESSSAVTQQRRVNPLLVGAVVVVLLALGIGWYFYSQGYEDTDDAQVDGHLNPIASRIDGTIKAVHVDDNQAVQTGELLVELDPSDDRVAFSKPKRNTTRPMAQLERFASQSTHHAHRQPERSHSTAQAEVSLRGRARRGAA